MLLSISICLRPLLLAGWYCSQRLAGVESHRRSFDLRLIPQVALNCPLFIDDGLVASVQKKKKRKPSNGRLHFCRHIFIHVALSFLMFKVHLAMAHSSILLIVAEHIEHRITGNASHRRHTGKITKKSTIYLSSIHTHTYMHMHMFIHTSRNTYLMIR